MKKTINDKLYKDIGAELGFEEVRRSQHGIIARKFLKIRQNEEINKGLSNRISCGSLFKYFENGVEVAL